MVSQVADKSLEQQQIELGSAEGMARTSPMSPIGGRLRRRGNLVTICDALYNRENEPGLVTKLAKEFGVSPAWIETGVIPEIARIRAQANFEAVIPIKSSRPLVPGQQDFGTVFILKERSYRRIWRKIWKGGATHATPDSSLRSESKLTASGKDIAVRSDFLDGHRGMTSLLS